LAILWQAFTHCPETELNPDFVPKGEYVEGMLSGSPHLISVNHGFKD